MTFSSFTKYLFRPSLVREAALALLPLMASGAAMLFWLIVLQRTAPEDFTLLRVAQSYITIAGPVSSLGLSFGILIVVSKNIDFHISYLRPYVVISHLSGLITSLVLWGVTYYTTGNEINKIILFSLTFTGALEVLTSFFQAVSSWKGILFSAILPKFLPIIFIFLWQGPTSADVVGAIIFLSAAIPAILLWISFTFHGNNNKIEDKFGPIDFKRTIFLSVKSIPNSLLYAAYLFFDMTVLIWAVPNQAQADEYARIAFCFSVIILLKNAAQPRLTVMLAKIADNKKRQRIVLNVSLLLFLIGFILMPSFYGVFFWWNSGHFPSRDVLFSSAVMFFGIRSALDLATVGVAIYAQLEHKIGYQSLGIALALVVAAVSVLVFSPLTGAGLSFIQALAASILFIVIFFNFLSVSSRTNKID